MFSTWVLVEVKLSGKLIFQFSHRAKIGQNDNSNPYIESTTVLSDRAEARGLRAG